MNIRKILTCIFLIISICSQGQTKYILNLKTSDWKLKLTQFHISEVIDERESKKDAGQVLMNGKSATAEFKASLEEDIFNLITNSARQDTSTVPLVLSFQKLSIKETGTLSKHKVSIDISIKLYRLYKGKRFEVFVSSSKPEMTIQGNYVEPYEKGISETIKNMLADFDAGLKKNPNLPALARSIKVIIDPTKEVSGNSDTIFWSRNRKLKWSDFKGKAASVPFMAQSNCLFSFILNPVVKDGILELHISLISCFEKNSSWVKKGSEEDPLLAHEQLHFDICELNVRKLKKLLSEGEFDLFGFEPQVNSIFDKGWNDYQKEQEKYDDETEHGIVTEKQQAWQEEVAKQLRDN